MTEDEKFGSLLNNNDNSYFLHNSHCNVNLPHSVFRRGSFGNTFISELKVRR